MMIEFRKTRNAFLLGMLVACLNTGYAQIGNAELADVIATMQGDDYDARYDARMILQDAVSKVSVPGMEKERVSLEKKLAALLEGDFPVTTKLWLLRQLNTIGSEASVDVVSRLLSDSDAHVADGARMALLFNPSAAAAKALERNGLAHENYEGDANSRFSDELATIRNSTNFAECETLARKGSNPSVRSAALLKCIELSSGKTARKIGAIITEEEEVVNSALLRIALLSERSNVARAALKLVEDLDTGSQAILVGSLAVAGQSASSEKTVLAIAKSDSEALQLQAIEALGKVGSVASLPLLMNTLDSKNRDLREAAADAIGSIKDSRIDSELVSSVRKGDDAARITAIRGLSYRNSVGASGIVNELATGENSVAIREAALEAMELVGDVDSLSVLVDLIVTEPASGGLRRDAQIALKRSSLRIGDPDAAWTAFKAGLTAAGDDLEARDALLAVADSVPTEEAIDYIRGVWMEGDDDLRRKLLGVLPAWRDWDGGFLMLEFASQEDLSEEIKDGCFAGIGRILLNIEQKYPLKEKFDLAGKSLAIADSEKRKQAILNGFRNADGRTKRFTRYNEVNPELKEFLAE